MDEVNSLSVSVGDVNALIAGYLQHCGYEDTLKSFQQASPQLENNSKDTANPGLRNRKKIRQCIMDGDIPAAIGHIGQLYYTQLSGELFANALLMLQSQCFIELIKNGKIEEAVKFAQQNLSKFVNGKAERKLTGKEELFLQEVLGLLAYEDPSNSPLGHLLQISQREIAADAVNTAILHVEKQKKIPSSLEQLLRQLLASLKLKLWQDWSDRT